ncbi:glycosyl hydrolase family 18 protein [Chitinophaga pinensis]|uniref:chitinase n=1 Tax=Chitinophaga pinensis (strain ATCC 43595 / DSM 2588 / LMG 13176 / NBRC 15968 / NCIMB 11800 / UQM 2034) TaxID=485918 RepID=A0A979GT74_CHIPD|nr:glycosyl hydrolase family 18 protein [Chitinophaga pinensis]ACU59676.1 Chitinase [Chitinophaga pinensis DSM 2588]
MKVNSTFRSAVSYHYVRHALLLLLLMMGLSPLMAQVTPQVPATTKNHSKQVIGYITQWDAWKDVAGIVPKGGYNQLNVDYSQYTILNFSFFGVAKDGSLHSGDFRNKNIYQVGAVQEPGALVNEDIYSSWDMFLLYGELDAPLYYISEGSYAYTLGYRNEGSGWKNVNTGKTGVFPLSVPKQGGAQGVLDLAHSKGVKVMASIGGWSMCKHYPEMAADATKRAKFVAGCVELMNMGFDGIDFDWEYPNDPGMNIERYSTADYNNFAALVEAVRTAIGPNKLITAAFAASPAKLQGFNWSRLNNSMNYYNMMTYDYNGGWSNKAGHNAPLYDYPGAEYTNFSVDATVKALKALGVNMSKVNIGAPFYGRGVVTSGAAALNGATTKRAETVQPDGPIQTCADYTNWAKDLWDGTPNYSYILQQTSSGWTEGWDDVAKVPYKTKGNYFLSYDNERSVGEKAKYIKDNGLAGVIIWQVYGDMLNMTSSTVAKGKLIYCPNTTSPLVNKINAVFADGSTPVNQAPVVNLTAPTANATFTAPASITVSANATDSDGSIRRVQFYNGGTSLGIDSVAPYSVSWSNVAAGTYSITAVATDNSGASTTSAAVSVTVTGGGTNPPVDNNKVVVGYWQNWNLASAPYIRLRDVDSRYNVIEVAFGTTSSDLSTVNFTPEGTTVADFKADIATLQAQGRKVLLSLGGETGTLVINTEANKQAFISSMKNLLDSYNFDGFDLDIEGGTSLQLNNGDNNFMAPTTPKVVNLIAAAKEIISYRKAQGKNCLLTMAPETYYVQTAYGATYSPLVGAYLPIIYGLRNELSWIQPQLYNTGSVMGLDNKVYNSTTADFIVSMTEMLLQGFPVSGTSQTFPALREDQVAFGLPAAPGAAGSGYTAPAEVKKALNYLTKGQSYGGTYVIRKAAGYPGLRGIMTWSVNWDKVNNSEFAANYYPYFFGTTPGNQSPVVSITSPASGASFTAPASITITASASDADGSIAKVEFYNGATKLGQATAAPYSYTWTNVAAATYSLTAVATDNAGAVTTSAAVSVTVNGTGGNTCDGIAAWSATIAYNGSQQVVYNGKIYTAKWWTQGDQPDTHSGADQVWAYVRDCGGSNPGNQAPTVSITSPSAGASFSAPATVTIQATAADADGTIAKVEFYNGNTKLGEVTASPYSYTWGNVAAGAYSITAVATDNGSKSTTSAAVAIQVGSGNTGNCAGVAAYEPFPKVYNQGDKVVYNGVLYESQSNGLYNVTPGTADWWWKPLGACGAAARVAVVSPEPDGVNADSKLVVFPNPLTGTVLKVQINAAQGEKVLIELWSTNGNAILRKQIVAGAKGQQTVDLDVSQVPAGSWILKTSNQQSGRKSAAKVIRL